MNCFTSRRLRGICLLALTALILVAVPVVRAMADTAPPPGEAAGSGSVEGTEVVNEATYSPTQGALCQQETKSIYGLRGVGTYKGRDASGQEVVYAGSIDETQGQTKYADGPIRIDVENTQTYYLGPNGTYGSDSNCSPANIGAAVPAEFRIFAADHVYRLDANGAQGPCVGHGSFARGNNADPNNSAPKVHAQWTLDADCTVIGNAAGTPGTGIAPAGSPHTYSGIHNPCFGDYCPTNIRVDYAQYLPFRGLHVAMGGPDTAAVGSTVTVTAGVTNNGTPLANAAVTFSVAGPAPSQPPSGAAVTGADGTASFTFTSANTGDYTITATATNTGVTVPSTTVPPTTVPPTTVPSTTVPSTTVPSTTVPSTTVPSTTVPPTTTPPTTTPAAPPSASGTHVVHFVPVQAMVLDGPARAQTEEPVTVTATLTAAGKPVPGSQVAFTVAGAPAWQSFAEGQPSPASGSAVTDQNGQATFTFSAGRAGDYTVNASSSTPGVPASASHAVHLDINTFQVAGRQPTQAFFGYPSAPALMDPAGQHAYFGAVEEFNLSTFQPGRYTPNAGGQTAVIDPAGNYAYYGTGFSTVVKVDLRTLQQVGVITPDIGGAQVTSSVIDPAGRYAYFGTWSPQSGAPGQVVKVDLATFQEVGSITLPAGEMWLATAVMDPAGRYAYFGSNGSLGRIVKIDLATFTRVGSAVLDGGAELELGSAVIDPKGDFAYFGTYSAVPGRVVKVDLNTFQRVGAITLDAQTSSLNSAVIDPAGRYAYFGAEQHVAATTGGNASAPSALLKVDLGAFQLDDTQYLGANEKQDLDAATIDPAGNFAYFGKAAAAGAVGPVPSPEPAEVIKVALSRPPAAWLTAGDDTYSTPYLTPLTVNGPGVLANDHDTQDPDPLTATLVHDAAHGSVNLKPDGSFTYTPASGFSGTDTFTYKADDAMDYSAPATVSITVPAPPAGVQAVNGSAFGYYTNVGLFGGPQSVHGGAGSTCEQAGQAACGDGQSVAVATPIGGGDVSATDPDGNVGSYGPAYIFQNSGAVTVHATGTTGPSGSVTASASVADIDNNDPFHAGGADGAVSSTCTANLSGVAGSTRIINGRLVTSLDAATGNAATEIDFPHTWDPAANSTYSGTLNNVGDHWRAVFNEQILGPDSITVNALHLYLLGPAAIGDMIIGQSHCGLNQAAPTTTPTPTATAATFTATAGQTLTVAAPGVLANDTDSDGAPLSAAVGAPVPPPTSGGGAWTFPSDPAHGTLALGADGSFSYTANAGYSGADTFTYQAQDARGATAAPATVTITVNPGVSHAVADFAGDATTDLSVFRPSGGQWLIADGSTTNLGAAGDIAVPCDYSGGGINQTAVYRPSTGGWYIAGQDPQYFGLPGDIPVPGHYGGDTNCDLAVFRPATGAWYIQNQPTQYLGLSGDIPVPAAYRGGAVTLPAVFRPSTGAWYIAGPVAGSVELAYYGLSGDIPVPADYTAGGAATIAVWRPSAGAWYIQNQATQYLGLQGDIPVPGNYTAGGGAAIAVFRPDSGGWYINGQATQYYGLNGDQPLPLPGAVTQTFFP